MITTPTTKLEKDQLPLYSILRLLDYLDDEEKDFYSSYDEGVDITDHIYFHILEIKKYLGLEGRQTYDC